MKTLMIILTMSCICFAKLRGNDGGGGTSLAAEFVFVGRSALQILKSERPSIGIPEVKSVLNKVEVFDVERICFQDPNDGVQICLDAQYNAVSKRVIFDRTKWAQKSCIDKFVITAHEYLRVAGLEDANYVHSSLFFGGLSNEGLTEIQAICRELIVLKGKREQAKGKW